MRLPQRFAALAVFAAISLAALAFSGLFDWIASSLFLVLELLAEFLRPLFGFGRRAKSPALARLGLAPAAEYGWSHQRRGHHRRGHGRRPRAGARTAETAGSDEETERPRPRILVPLSEDRPELVAFAMDECRSRRAELLLLLVRPLAVLPMGPDPLPGLDEDAPAQALLDRLREQARDAGIPLRVFYEVTRDVPATILETARTQQADVLVMETTRRSFLWRALLRDQVQEVMSHLPDRVSLMIHAS